MSHGINHLHSHSAIERALEFPKRTVLIDETYGYLFADVWSEVEPMQYNGVKYLKVPVLEFIRHNGVFKNLIA